VTVRAGHAAEFCNSHALGSEDLVERGGELGVAIPDEGTDPLFKIHEQVA
jgi:hypothetical protein